MKYSQLYQTDAQLSQLSLGTWVFSGGTWGDANEQDCIGAVHAAMDMGINVIDTAPIYGNGRAESIVGKSLQQGRRDHVIIASKCGLVAKGKSIALSLKPESIFAEIEQSLRRLKTDHIDLYQCHWPDPKTPMADTLACLMELKQQGKIRWIGVSNFTLQNLKDAVPSGCVQTLQSPLSMLDRAIAQEILPFCVQHQIGVFAYGPLGGGILSGKYSEPPVLSKEDARSFFYKYYRGESFQRITGFLKKISSLNYRLSEIALNWVRQQDGVVSVIAGCRNAAQVARNVSAIDWELSRDEMTFINQAITEFGI